MSQVLGSGSVTPMGYGESTATESEAGDSEAAEPIQDSNEYNQQGNQTQPLQASHDGQCLLQ